MTTIADLNKRARDLKASRDNILALRRKEAAADPSMTSAARTEYLAHWRKSLDKQFAPKFAELREDAAAHGRSIKRQADRVRPKIDPNNAADLVRTEQAWRNVVLPQLEKGRTLTAALRNADADAVLGAERFAAGWVQANSPATTAGGLAGLEFAGEDGKLVGRDQQVDTTSTTRVIERRLAELVDPAAGQAIREAAVIDDSLAAFEKSARHAETGEGNSLEIAIGTHLAEQQANATDDEDAAADAA